MPTVGEAFPSGESVIYPFPSPGFTYLLYLICVCGIFTNVPVALANLRTKYYPSCNSLLTNSLVCCDLLMFSVIFVTTSFSIHENGYANGAVACYLQQVVAVAMCCTSMATLCATTLERYFSLYYQFSLTVPQMRLAIVLIWSFCLLTSLLPYITSSETTTVSLQPAMIYCNFSWHTRNPYGIFMNLLTALIPFLSISGMSVAYGQMIATYRSMNKANQMGQNNGGKKKEREKKKNEHRLMVKGIVLSSAFAICWSPYIFLIAISMITGQEPSPSFDSIATGLGIFNSLLNPILLYTFDPVTKANVMDCYNWKSTKNVPSERDPINPSPIEIPVEVGKEWADTQIVPGTKVT